MMVSRSEVGASCVIHRMRRMPPIDSDAATSTTTKPDTTSHAASGPVRAMLVPLKPVTVMVRPASCSSVCARLERFVSWSWTMSRIFALSEP
jgi:hypothetical protein